MCIIGVQILDDEGGRHSASEERGWRRKLWSVHEEE
jgi:hypothetical protein